MHTVFYFNYNEVPAFTNQSNAFKKLKELWLELTDDNGNVNICTSSLSSSDDCFAVEGNGKYYYTILGDISKLTKNKGYHEQKNRLDKKAGFVHWVSYLAKNEQKAEKKKTFGTRSYLK
ncbi:hypothetical protein [Photobacterium damselae]|uniref:hypothetical protein n=1 Tax=Photobacterium damselae TaxID=38293 RepID=UPI004067FD78